jgi:hypothetical protein
MYELSYRSVCIEIIAKTVVSQTFFKIQLVALYFQFFSPQRYTQKMEYKYSIIEIGYNMVLFNFTIDQRIYIYIYLLIRSHLPKSTHSVINFTKLF